MKTEKALLGVLGGLGPMSTVYFYELLTSHTKASSDAEHLDLLISSRATTPDRTAFILGHSKEDPLPVMREEAERLVAAGATLLVIPCNTAHYFYEGLQQKCPVPILNIIRETVAFLNQNGIKRFSLLATEGTVTAGSYQKISGPLGLECVIPTQEEQAIVSSVIYDHIKQNKPADMQKLLSVVRSMEKRGSEITVLGCTELSLLKKQFPYGSAVVDSLEVLAYRTIQACHKKPVGFPPEFDRLQSEVLL